jgi:hypothetical protein
MKNAYQRRRVKARVEKSARMKRLDAITLEFARQVIEEETGAPLDIPAPTSDRPQGAGTTLRQSSGQAEGAQAGVSHATSRDEVKLVARDDRKNPLTSTFDWTDDAVQRIFRVPAGFMRNKTQERVEELARERAAAAIDLALVEDGIEFGKKMMAEMIASYPAPASAGAGPRPETPREPAVPSAVVSEPSGGSYLNEVRSR